MREKSLNDKKIIQNINPLEKNDKKKTVLNRLQYKLKKLDEKVHRVLDKFPHLKKKAMMIVVEKMQHQETRCHRIKGRKLGELIRRGRHHIWQVKNKIRGIKPGELVNRG